MSVSSIKGWWLKGMLLLVSVLFSIYSTGQNTPFHIRFTAHLDQSYGFDAPVTVEWQQEYTLWKNAPVPDYYIPVKSCAKGKGDLLKAQLFNTDSVAMDSVRFWIGGTNQEVSYRKDSKKEWTLFLPPLSKNYTLTAWYKRKEVGRVRVITYAPKKEKVFLIPLTTTALNTEIVEANVNGYFKQANVSIDLTILPVFKHEEWKNVTLYDNPVYTYEKYTNQMHNVRDAYLAEHPDLDNKAYYIFIVPGFEDENISGFMLRNKALGFVKNDKLIPFSRSLAVQLARGLGSLQDSWQEDGPSLGSTTNLMDNPGGSNLRYTQWERLRFRQHSYSLFDSYEDVRSNNGFVAYYFWKEDKNGNIDCLGEQDLLKSLRRPYKKNYLSYHLNIDNVLFKPLFFVWGYQINVLHVLTGVVLLVGIFYFGRKLGKKIRQRFRRWRLLRFTWRIVQLFLFVSLGYFLFLFINLGYVWFEVHNGKLTDLDGMSFDKAIDYLEDNDNPRQPSEPELCSEILIRRGKNWYRSERMQVLYFSLKQDKNERWNQLRFLVSSDSLTLTTKNTSTRAESHYIVINYVDKQGGFKKQRVFNHLGVDITEKLQLKDPPKRILLFVNGYRPTSVGQSFEENFADIQKKGLEYPDSRNLVYAFDRFEYWRPWNQIDVKFQQRINPSETYYADGHFSVSTSNHRSLINFTTTSVTYPKRCANPKKHHCYTTQSVKNILGKKRVQTISVHRTRPNKRGFKKRKTNGHVAGRNIYQLLNEIPNRSKNDTIYIVAHSMGYAYALGIIDELRGKIHFGGFYIIAPENASVGTVRKEEWKEVWQYGSNFSKERGEAPCLLDGVAPQVRAGGLSNSDRIYIPKKLYKKKGFFNSHFIGYYTWVLEIPKGKKGHVTTH